MINFLNRSINMPGFGNPFAGLANDRMLTHDELVRAIRFLVSAEYEAIQLYTQLAESVEDRLAVEVLRSISDEERVHAGEFLKLLKALCPDEKKFYEEGEEEVEKEMEKLGRPEKGAGFPWPNFTRRA